MAVPADTRRALALLAVGATTTEASRIVALPTATVRGLAAKQPGWLIDEQGRVYSPDAPASTPVIPAGVTDADLSWARATLGTPERLPAEDKDLLARAAEIDDRKVRSALERAVKALGVLRDAVLRADECARIREEIAQAEAKLAELRANARELGAAGRAAGTPKAGVTGASSAEIRAWAKANGIEIRNSGIIPRRVRSLYEQAMTS